MMLSTTHHDTHDTHITLSHFGNPLTNILAYNGPSTSTTTPATRYIWESSADGNFAISEDADGEPLGRGTELRIFLKEECQEYLDEAKLQELVGKYSEFINFPIYLWVRGSWWSCVASACIYVVDGMKVCVC